MRSERGDASVYILLVPLLLATILVVLALVNVQAVQTARAEVSARVERALVIASDELAAADAASGYAGVTEDQVRQAVEQALQEEMPQQWSWTLDQVTAYTDQQAGSPAPFGVPGGVIPGAGVYAEVTVAWPIPAFGIRAEIPVGEFLQANAYDDVENVWNPASAPGGS